MKYSKGSCSLELIMEDSEGSSNLNNSSIVTDRSQNSHRLSTAARCIALKGIPSASAISNDGSDTPSSVSSSCSSSGYNVNVLPSQNVPPVHPTQNTVISSNHKNVPNTSHPQHRSSCTPASVIPKRERFGRRTISDQGPTHLWSHNRWARRNPRKSPTQADSGEEPERRRPRRSWPVGTSYKRSFSSIFS
ncbi:UNVERIFIED_CONTAM: hypothetical protein RMT77_009988 [Armadillidium vulgare]